MAQQDVFYRDIMETSHATTWDAVFQAVDRILRFFQAVRARFVERDLVLEQLMYAMMLREHMMIDGPTGAAKSMMIDAAFSHIIGAVVWAMDLTRFTTDVQLFGSYDVREMRRSGKSLHLTEGSIAEANFAQTGEFFDANDPALRSLLGVLNERRVRKGPQFIQVPLLTAIADTNLHPEDLPEPRRNALDAVIDRFLFRTPVDYVVEPANRVTMIQVSLDRGRTAPIPELTLDDIVLVSGVVQEMNLVTDPYVIEAYQDMTLRYAQARKQAGGKWVSDRRTVRGAQIMEVSALMHGRTSVTFEDLEITRHVLAHNGDDTTMLEKARTEALETWIKRSHRREIEADRQKLKEVTKKAQIPTDLTTVDSEQLKTMHMVDSFCMIFTKPPNRTQFGFFYHFFNFNAASAAATCASCFDVPVPIAICSLLIYTPTSNFLA